MLNDKSVVSAEVNWAGFDSIKRLSNLRLRGKKKSPDVVYPDIKNTIP
jgi:hypothetical protein